MSKLIDLEPTEPIVRREREAPGSLFTYQYPKAWGASCDPAMHCVKATRLWVSRLEDAFRGDR